ncbi:hypothetical protein [uncultured Roseobacter sp.]|uniref:hypothetical protein n=1 Tax=uncultured Roseobacter sp. TaxID=114847 RepID=UPI00262E789A|nr:hypothetical protein [uncultured Roseobacter sp.]
MRPIIEKLALLLSVAILAGCASGASPIAMKPTSIAPVSTSSIYAKQIGSTDVTGGRETSPLWTSEISDTAFQSALDSALLEGGYIRDGGPLRVAADLIAVEQPLFGASMTVEMTVRYRVLNSAGRALFDQTIRTPHTAAYNEAFLGVERLRLANEGAARANLAAFLTALRGARPS